MLMIRKCRLPSFAEQLNSIFLLYKQPHNYIQYQWLHLIPVYTSNIIHTITFARAWFVKLSQYVIMECLTYYIYIRLRNLKVNILGNSPDMNLLFSFVITNKYIWGNRARLEYTIFLQRNQ